MNDTTRTEDSCVKEGHHLTTASGRLGLGGRIAAIAVLALLSSVILAVYLCAALGKLGG